MNIFQKISASYGNQKNACEALGVPTSTFSSWVKEQKKPSISNVKMLVKKLGIPREEIRPDIFGK